MYNLRDRLKTNLKFYFAILHTFDLLLFVYKLLLKSKKRFLQLLFRIGIKYYLVHSVKIQFEMMS